MPLCDTLLRLAEHPAFYMLAGARASWMNCGGCSQDGIQRKQANGELRYAGAFEDACVTSYAGLVRR